MDIDVKKETKKLIWITLGLLFSVPFIVITFVIVYIVISGISSVYSKNANVPKGYYDFYEALGRNTNGNYLDYGEYYYKGASTVLKDDIYQVVKEEDINKIKDIFTNVKELMKKEDRQKEYDFDDTVISKGDYFYLNERGKHKYIIYFFDMDSNTLYYVNLK